MLKYNTVLPIPVYSTSLNKDQYKNDPGNSVFNLDQINLFTAEPWVQGYCPLADYPRIAMLFTFLLSHSLLS